MAANQLDQNSLTTVFAKGMVLHGEEVSNQVAEVVSSYSGGPGSSSLGPVYSPQECVEQEFCALRVQGVLRSSHPAGPIKVLSSRKLVCIPPLTLACWT